MSQGQECHFLALQKARLYISLLLSLWAEGNRSEPGGHPGRYLLMMAEPPTAWILNYCLEERCVPTRNTTQCCEVRQKLLPPLKYLDVFVTAARVTHTKIESDFIVALSEV